MTVVADMPRPTMFERICPTQGCRHIIGSGLTEEAADRMCATVGAVRMPEFGIIAVARQTPFPALRRAIEHVTTTYCAGIRISLTALPALKALVLVVDDVQAIPTVLDALAGPARASKWGISAEFPLPLAGRWICGVACRDRLLRQQLDAENRDFSIDGHDPRANRDRDQPLPNSLAELIERRRHETRLRCSLPSCGDELTVSDDSEKRARWLSSNGWTVDGRYSSRRCSEIARQTAGAAPPPTAPTRTIEDMATIRAREAAARERNRALYALPPLPEPPTPQPPAESPAARQPGGKKSR